MSEHDVSLERSPEAIDELMRKVAVLKRARPKVYADVVHPGIAAAITDPTEAKTVETNRALRSDFEKA